jgi:hypothetical protein
MRELKKNLKNQYYELKFLKFSQPNSTSIQYIIFVFIFHSLSIKYLFLFY